jgi:hypothetical protein
VTERVSWKEIMHLADELETVTGAIISTQLSNPARHVRFVTRCI